MKKQVAFKVGNETLRGDFYIPKAKNPPCVIIFHGSGSTGEKYLPLAKQLMEKGIFSLFFNFRGCGKSDGEYLKQTVENALEDAKTAFNLLLKQKVDQNRVGIYGGSFGGDIATLILPEFPQVKSLVLRAPSAVNRPLASKIDMGGIEKEWAYLSNKKKWANAANFKNIREFKGDLLIIKSEKDDNVPPIMVEEYYADAINTRYKSLEIIKEADHRLSNPEWVKEFTQLSLDWFVNTL